MPVEVRPSLRHVKLRVKKSWLAAAAWTVIVSGGGWLISMFPLMYSWEQGQVTREQLGRVLYDTLDPDTRQPMPTRLFDERSLPSEGVMMRLNRNEGELAKLRQSYEEQLRVNAELRGLVVDQYRFRVRWAAADAEHDARKKKDRADRAEAKFDHALSSGADVDEAFRRALEQNPYR